MHAVARASRESRATERFNAAASGFRCGASGSALGPLHNPGQPPEPQTRYHQGIEAQPSMAPVSICQCTSHSVPKTTAQETASEATAASSSLLPTRSRANACLVLLQPFTRGLHPKRQAPIVPADRYSTIPRDQLRFSTICAVEPEAVLTSRMEEDTPASYRFVPNHLRKRLICVNYRMPLACATQIKQIGVFSGSVSSVATTSRKPLTSFWPYATSSSTGHLHNAATKPTRLC
ncbi:hypothetical protein BJ994_002864 [Arthrobacter pigmenti]|uniref:Uncharacterized protein n=1 Tax=Arthrobacter pigmenti TaxID=271432 RepID=A0A846RKD5_9MICC|nr:hypothetical protein [Arthrobacter pigmenti]